jgi:hypothetical protein
MQNDQKNRLTAFLLYREDCFINGAFYGNVNSSV